MSYKTDHLQLMAIEQPGRTPSFHIDVNCSVSCRTAPYGVIFAALAAYTMQTIQHYVFCK